MAIRLDIPVDQGSDVRVPLTIVDDWKEMDLTGYTARMQCRPFAASRKVVDLLTTENGRIKIDGAVLVLHWPHEISEALAAGACVYDLELVSGGGEVTRILTGKVFVSKEVTQWPE